VRENGKKYSKVIEKLGTVADLEKKLGGQDPIQWAEEYEYFRMSANAVIARSTEVMKM
jgi:hypothetical protein